MANNKKNNSKDLLAMNIILIIVAIVAVYTIFSETGMIDILKDKITDIEDKDFAGEAIGKTVKTAEIDGDIVQYDEMTSECSYETSSIKYTPIGDDGWDVRTKSVIFFMNNGQLSRAMDHCRRQESFGRTISSTEGDTLNEFDCYYDKNTKKNHQAWKTVNCNCTNGVCQNECFTNEECTEGSKCQNGECVPIAKPAECGNNVSEEGEECDGEDLKGESCSSIYSEWEGELACFAAEMPKRLRCRFNTRSCSIPVVVNVTVPISNITCNVSQMNGTTYILAQCCDSIDNDNDTMTDYPFDVHCESALDNNETYVIYTNFTNGTDWDQYWNNTNGTNNTVLPNGTAPNGTTVNTSNVNITYGIHGCCMNIKNASVYCTDVLPQACCGATTCPPDKYDTVSCDANECQEFGCCVRAREVVCQDGLNYECAGLDELGQTPMFKPYQQCSDLDECKTGCCRIFRDTDHVFNSEMMKIQCENKLNELMKLDPGRADDYVQPISFFPGVSCEAVGQFGSIQGRLFRCISPPPSCANSEVMPLSYNPAIRIGGYTVIPDVEGNFKIDNIPVGTYTLTASADGHTTKNKLNNIISNGAVEEVGIISLFPLAESEMTTI